MELNGLELDKIFRLFIAFVLIAVYSCKPQEEIVPEVYLPKTHHEAYLIGLENTGLSETALGAKWIKASLDALDKAVSVTAPFEEEFYILDSEVRAYSYRVSGLKGQNIELSIEQTRGDSSKIFLDAFRVQADSSLNPKHIASYSDDNFKLGFEVGEDGDYIIRFQNELLRSGQYRLKILLVPSLEFPVAGRGKQDIGSLFGVPRDAGKRKHEGIDIFARRHTPIVAPCDGNINWAGVREGSLGGKVIWMRDMARNQTLYFAHLEDVFVAKGDKVIKGDTIGSVGNSGNAITTSPHLHFGIYKDGAIDPYHHVLPTRTRTSRLLADSDLVSEYVKTKRKSTLRINSTSKDSTQILVKNQFAKVVGVSSSYYHISTPDGIEGYVFYDDVVKIKNKISNKFYEGTPLLSKPNSNAVVLKQNENLEVEVMGLNDKYEFVQTADGQNGWIGTDL